MSVNDGQLVNAAISNAAWWDVTGNTSGSGKYSVINADSASGGPIYNFQREMNAVESYTGLPSSSVYNVTPSWTNNDVGTSSDTLKARSDSITLKFNSSTGHGHTGAAGDAPKLTAINIVNTPSGNLSSTNQQAANNELQSDIDGRIPVSIFTNKGDIISSSGSGIAQRLGVGSNNQVLMADSAQTVGIKWAVPPASAISNTPSGNLSSTDVQSALNECQTHIDTANTNAVQKSTYTAKGSILAATAASTPANVAVGTDGYLLKSDSTAAAGVSWTAPTAGGGGGSSLMWVESVQCPESGIDVISSVPNNEFVYFFTKGATQNLYASIKVPASYTAGPVKVNLPYYTPDTSSTVQMLAQATLIRSSAANSGPDALTVTTNQRTTTNAAVTLSGAANLLRIAILDVTDGSGQINSVAVKANDVIKIRLYRADSGATNPVRVIPYDSEVTFS